VTREKVFKFIAGVILLLAIYAGCITTAFFITSHFFRNTRDNPPIFIQIINSFLGLFLSICIFFLLRFKHMVQIKQALAATINAIEKITKGDFNVRLQLGFHIDEEFEELMQSVDKMALELNQLERMRQEFISNVSHEIQSPLTSIRGFAQALRNNPLSDEDRLHYVSIIETESIRLSQLSDSMLKLAYLEAENNKFEPAHYRLDQQIRTIILTCEPQWMQKQLEFEVFLEELSIRADEELLSQVWINLIHNSIKFTPENGQIQIELYRQGDIAVCRISDTGIGITEENQPHIFERFYKADKARDRSQQGSGLGLSIAKKIVDMHQGTISVQSILGAGTTFTVTLPLKRHLK
jgi:two-component system phosphate regulon sensor histidine kinase PhoR